METKKGLTKAEKDSAKAKIKDMAMEDKNISEEDAKKIEEMFELAKMPIKLKDKDIKLGEGEVDIRGLSEENYKQMIFRLFVLNNVYIKDLCTSMIDCLRLIMLVLKKMGYTDIVKATDDLMSELQKQSKLN